MAQGRGPLGCQLPGEDAEPHTLLSHALRKIKPSGVLASPTPKDSNLHLESSSPFSRKIYCTYEQMLKELGWSFAMKTGSSVALCVRGCVESRPAGTEEPAHACHPPATLPRPRESGGRALPLARAGLPWSSAGCWLSRHDDFCISIDISCMYILAMLQLIHDLSVSRLQQGCHKTAHGQGVDSSPRPQASPPRAGVSSFSIPACFRSCQRPVHRSLCLWLSALSPGH